MPEREPTQPRSRGLRRRHGKAPKRLLRTVTARHRETIETSRTQRDRLRPLDMALMPTSWSNVELAWDDQFAARFFERASLTAAKLHNGVWQARV